MESDYSDNADIFSLGCTLYWLIYRNFPFQRLIEDLQNENIIDSIGNMDRKVVAERMKEYRITFPRDDLPEEYGPAVDFMEFILDFNSEEAAVWTNVIEHEYVKNCLRFLRICKAVDGN